MVCVGRWGLKDGNFELLIGVIFLMRNLIVVVDGCLFGNLVWI